MACTTLSLHVGRQCRGGSADEPRGPHRGHVYLTPWPDSQSAVRPVLTAERVYDLRGHGGSGLTGSSLKGSRDTTALTDSVPVGGSEYPRGPVGASLFSCDVCQTEADEQLKMYFSVSKILYVVYFFLNNGSCQNGFLKTWEFKMNFTILENLLWNLQWLFFARSPDLLALSAPCNFLEWMRYSIMSRLQSFLTFLMPKKRDEKLITSSVAQLLKTKRDCHNCCTSCIIIIINRTCTATFRF